MLIENEIKLDYKDVLFRPKRSTLRSRKDVDLYRKFSFRNSKSEHQYNGVPIMTANMDGVGTFEMAKMLRRHAIMTCLVKTYTVEELSEYFTSWGGDYTAMSIGATKNDLNKFKDVQKRTGGKVQYLCVDVANGYTEFFSDFIYNLRAEFPKLIIIAGNVVTADQTQELILNGADIVKVGIGPGSVCTTRIQTGVGYPQLSAVIECADAAHGLGGYIIADGGCTSPGDVAKAFGGGADFVMLGGMLAGHDEGGGEVITKTFELDQLTDKGDGWYEPIYEVKKFVQFYGMSSETANDKHFGGLKDYRAAEGKKVEINYKGSVNNTVQEILGGIRSTCTYIGARNIKSVPKCATFIRCNDTHNRVYE